MTTPSGWYPDTASPGMERYWDGTEWTLLQRRIAPIEVPAEPEPLSPLDLGPGRDLMAEARAHVAASMEVAQLKHEQHPTVCLVAGCMNERAEGYYACAEHVAEQRAHGYEPTTVFVEPDLAPTGKAALICPHCQVRGRVQTRTVRQKKGISGGKAAGAVLTGGLSILGTGLSRKEQATEMWCRNCNTKWYV